MCEGCSNTPSHTNHYDTHPQVGFPSQRTPIPMTATKTRNENLVARAEQGYDLALLAREAGVSRQRVHQIVTRLSTMSPEDIEAKRLARREETRIAEATKVANTIRETAESNPDATINTLAQMCQVDSATVREALPYLEVQRRSDEPPSESVSDEEIFATIRAVSALDGGDPLSGPFYDTHRGDRAVTRARLLQRFGTWGAACDAAGVSWLARETRTYSRRWNETQMLDYAWDYLNSTSSPTFLGFDSWLGTQNDAPSAQTVRNTLGTWVEIKRQAIAAHAAATSPETVQA